MARILDLGEKILDRYEVIEVLGQGGMGIVYRCLDRVSDMMVAVKGLSPELADDRDWMEEIKRNFRTVVELRHSVIAGLRNIEQDKDGACYVVMDYVSGEDLPDYLSHHQLTNDNAFIILLDIADALDYAHGEGIIHRDVKPDNVRIGSDKSVKLLDLGIAAKVSSRDARLCAGTPGYMAPEQKAGLSQSGATDEYALAVMAYKMFYGQLPPDDLSFPNVSSAKVRAVYAKALAQEPKSRYGSCKQFVWALALAMGVKGVAPRQLSWLGWSVAIGLFAALVVSTWVFFVQLGNSDELVRKKDAMIVALQRRIEDIGAKLKNSVRISEDEKEELTKERDNLLRRQQQIMDELKEQNLAQQRERDEQIASIKSQLAKLESEKADLQRAQRERESKVGNAPIVVSVGKPDLSEDELHKAGVGFYYARLPWHGEADPSFDTFCIWGYPNKSYESCPRLLESAVSGREGNSAHVYVSLMEFKRGVRYSFHAEAHDVGKIFVGGRLVADSSLPNIAFPGVKFDRDGYHRITLVVLDRDGHCGKLGNIGMRYRKDNGDWLPFAATSAQAPFRVSVSGIDPLAEDEEYRRRALCLKPGFNNVQSSSFSDEQVYAAVNVWGNDKREESSCGRAMMTSSIGENETAVCATYMFFKPNTVYEFSSNVDDHGYVYLDDELLINEQLWEHPVCRSFRQGAKGAWHRLVMQIWNYSGPGGASGSGIMKYRENGGEWQPFVVDMDNVVFRRVVEGRNPIAEERTLCDRLPRRKPIRRINKITELNEYEDFTYYLRFRTDDMTPGKCIVEFRHPESDDGNRFFLSFDDAQHMVLQYGKSRRTCAEYPGILNHEYKFKRGEEYQLLLTADYAGKNSVCLKLYAGTKTNDNMTRIMDWTCRPFCPKFTDVQVDASRSLDSRLTVNRALSVKQFRKFH